MYEMWGKGYDLRKDHNKYTDRVDMMEEAFWDTYEANLMFDDPDQIQVLMGHFPHGGVSNVLLEHMGQNWKSDQFRFFNYNTLEEERKDYLNIIRYGKKEAPYLDFKCISDVNIPI